MKKRNQAESSKKTRELSVHEAVATKGGAPKIPGPRAPGGTDPLASMTTSAFNSVSNSTTNSLQGVVAGGFT